MVRSTENCDNRRSAKARILEVYEMDGNWKAQAENLSIPIQFSDVARWNVL